MPSILELFKTYNDNKEITIWNGERSKEGIGQTTMDFVKAESNPNGPRVLFYKKLVTPPLIYGTETPRISLKGTVDPQRSLSVASANYNDDATKKPPVLNLGSLLGGSANRPSDTIFDKITNAPVSKGTLPTSAGDHSALRNSIKAGQDYDVSKVPMGANALAGVVSGDLNQIADKAVGAAIAAAKKAVLNTTSGLVTKLVTKKTGNSRGNELSLDAALTSFFRKGNSGKLYRGGTTSVNGDTPKGNVKNSEYYTTYGDTTNKRTNKSEYIADGVTLRKAGADIDSFNQRILEKSPNSTDPNDTNPIGASFIKIKPLGKTYSLIFPATISNISETVTPEWSPFKYVGSPYNTYRYNGVERALSFDFKLYYFDEGTKGAMKRNLNSLKELTFPYDEVSTIKYAGDEVALTFAPNLIELTVNGLYKNIFGFITTLSFTVDDTTSWAGEVNGDSELYPTTISVSFGMTIIENQKLDNSSDPNVKVFRYDFDGLGIKTASDTGPGTLKSGIKYVKPLSTQPPNIKL
jgi:hypothetical protein